MAHSRCRQRVPAMIALGFALVIGLPLAVLLWAVFYPARRP